VAPDPSLLVRLRDAAPTLLESLLWGWLLGDLSADAYFEELEITQLSGPGYLTDDFCGEP
jgi:hypothetical protein